jgi:hypothetical protein
VKYFCTGESESYFLNSLSQPLTEMSIRNFRGGVKGSDVADNLTAIS